RSAALDGRQGPALSGGASRGERIPLTGPDVAAAPARRCLRLERRRARAQRDAPPDRARRVASGGAPHLSPPALRGAVRDGPRALRRARALARRPLGGRRARAARLTSRACESPQVSVVTRRTAFARGFAASEPARGGR